jgi:hypothetical protein
MKMLAPELSPATVFWSQIETKITKCNIGEAQRDLRPYFDYIKSN